MNKCINNLLLIIFLINAGNEAKAQEKDIEIVGHLIEQESAQPFPYATVALYDKSTKKVITGTTTDARGKFSINATTPGFYITISFMGFQTKTLTEFQVTNSGIDLGTIFLVKNNQALEEVVVRGEVSKTVFKLDKRIFNVGKDISSTGMSALEVLNNVPSVNVNIEGQVSLRGSAGVQILINGKPSVLADESSNALGTITADMIESIEVITNPSAKYEASGTAGILNIILKKEEKKGWNGSISANTGLPDNHSLGLSLNRRTEKLNLFTQMGVGYRSLPEENESVNRNLIDKEVVYSEGTSYRNENFYNLTLGTDYHINERNILTLSGNFAYEIEAQPSENHFRFFDSDNELVSSWVRNETTEATNPKWEYELNYKKQFPNNEEHSLQVSALGSFFGKNQSSAFKNSKISGSDIDRDQQTKTDFLQADYTFQVDYTNPLSKQYTLETGAQYVMNDVGNNYEVRDLIDGAYITNANLTNNFEYNQKVLGIYATGAYEKNKWGAKAGLRVENTDLQTLLTNSGAANSKKFTNLFPSFHTSYKIGENFSLQAGYSKRIFRPRLWDLNPFFNISNTFNIRVGNPDLIPEFTDSYELTSIYKIGKASLSSSVYHRYTTDVIERVSAFKDNVTITTPENVGTNASLGFETNAKYNATGWLAFTGDFNFHYFDRKGNFQAQSFDFSGSQWSSKLSSKIGLPADITVELTGSYQSGFQTVQGEEEGFAFMDLGFRKKIVKGKAMVNVGVRDLFESRVSKRFVSQPTFKTYDFGQRGRFVTLGISYGFGKGEAMTYSGGRR